MTVCDASSVPSSPSSADGFPPVSKLSPPMLIFLQSAS